MVLGVIAYNRYTNNNEHEEYTRGFWYTRYTYGGLVSFVALVWQDLYFSGMPTPVPVRRWSLTHSLHVPAVTAAADTGNRAVTRSVASRKTKHNSGAAADKSEVTIIRV